MESLVKTTKEILKDHMNNGFGVCKGSAAIISGRQSGGRRLQEIMQSEGSKYCFIMAEPKRGGAPYKVFFQIIKRLLKIEKTEKETFVITGRTNRFLQVRSREFNSRKSAQNAIKSCQG